MDPVAGLEKFLETVASRESTVLMLIALLPALLFIYLWFKVVVGPAFKLVGRSVEIMEDIRRMQESAVSKLDEIVEEVKRICREKKGCQSSKG